MPRDMFGDVVAPSIKVGSQAWYTVPLSILAHVALFAAVIIIPLAYYIITEWMGNFAYRAELNYLTFVIVALLAMLFAFLTVAFHSLKTARTNPVESLKYE